MGDYPGRPYHRTRARLRGEVTALLDDGTGRIRPELQPFAENIIAMPKPDRARCWIRNNSRLRDYLQALGSGELALTHEAFHQLDSPRTAAHLRDLLMAAGALPPLDRQIALFTAWALPRLTATTEPEDRRLLAQFLHWHLLPTLHASSRRRPLGPGHRNSAAESFIWSQRLLRWARRRDRPLSQLSAADLDRWRCLHPDRSAQVFLRWAANTGHGPAYTPPPAARQPTPRLGPAQRTSLTQRMFTDNSSTCAPASQPACCWCSPSPSAGSSASPLTTSSSTTAASTSNSASPRRPCQRPSGASCSSCSTTAAT